MARRTIESFRMERDEFSRKLVDVTKQRDELLEALHNCAISLAALRLAIEAGDPVPELLVRIDDIRRDNQSAIAKAERLDDK